MDIKKSFNPIGVIVDNLPGFAALIEKMVKTWEELKAAGGSLNWTTGIQFISRCLDDIIVFLFQHEIPGQDKKATALDGIGVIYDKVASSVMPWWLKIFSGFIRKFVFDVLLSHFIDDNVEKQKELWTPEASVAVLSHWGVAN
jgi:hypothetical protein